MKIILDKIIRSIKNDKRMIVFISIMILIVFIIWFFTIIFTGKVALSCEDAEKIVLNKMNGGIVTECKLKRKIYEIEIIYKNYEYEFKINANTGQIISYDSDYKDNDD